MHSFPSYIRKKEIIKTNINEVQQQGTSTCRDACCQDEQPEFDSHTHTHTVKISFNEYA